MDTTLSVEEIFNLVRDTLKKAGSSHNQSVAVAETISIAERDGSVSHGLFRLPGYFASLKSGKVNANPKPKLTQTTKAVLKCDGDRSYAPLVHKMFLNKLVEMTKDIGVGILSINSVAHFASLWPETEVLAENGLVGIACTSYLPTVAPFGSHEKFYGTNPISFAWPRKNKFPLVFDMATSTLAMGDVQIAARDGHPVPLGTGLGPDRKPSDDPKEILKGVLLPFGGYKGSAISMMIELFSAGLTGDNFSFEAAKTDNNDGGPAKGGELVLAINPELIAGPDWNTHSEGFFEEIKQLKGIRLPGERRHRNRLDNSPRKINKELLKKIRGLSDG